MNRKEDFGVKTLDGKDYEVPVEGSLGLLALGYIGLMIWREKKLNASKSPENSKKQNHGQ